MSNKFIGYLMLEVWKSFKSESILMQQTALETARALTATSVGRDVELQPTLDQFMQLLRDTNHVREDKTAFAAVSRTMDVVLTRVANYRMCNDRTISWLTHWLNKAGDIASKRVLAAMALGYARSESETLSCFGSTAFYHYLDAVGEGKEKEAADWLSVVKAESARSTLPLSTAKPADDK